MQQPSYYHGKSSIPLLGTTLGHIIDMAPHKFGERIAVVDRFYNIRKTITEFKQQVDQVAMGLLALGLDRGDLLGVWCPNRYEWMLCQMAAGKAGIILVAINPALQKMEFQYILDNYQLRAIVIQETFKTQNYYDIITHIVPEIKHSKSRHFNSNKYPHLTTVIVLSDEDLPGTVKFSDVYSIGGDADRSHLQLLQSKIQMDDTLMIMFTSGTTGKPKGVTLSHFNFINDGHVAIDLLNYFKKPHRIACNVPLFHVFGCLGGTFAAMMSGATCVFPGPAYNPEDILRTIEEEKCTSVYGTPTMFYDLINHPKFSQTDVSSVEVGITAGAPISPENFQLIIDKFNATGICNGYGGTELSGISCLNRLGLAPLNSVGPAIANTEVKIVDADNCIVPIGLAGEICFRGFHVMKGYWNDPERTKEVIIEGWYHTGDRGTLDADGNLYVVGRIKDMIIRGGENIDPREIEELLVTHPKIAIAQVFGVSDVRMGEEVCVWVQLKDNESMLTTEVQEFCKGKIAHFKIPKYIRFVTVFPKTPSGKVMKYVMRESMEKELS